MLLHKELDPGSNLPLIPSPSSFSSLLLSPSSLSQPSLQKVAGDGSCLFHSVAVSLGQGKTGSGLRSLAASEVSRLKSTEFNGASLEQWIEWETGLSASDYASRMSEGASWGGQVELAILAGALGRSIEVYRQENDATFTREHSFGQGDAVRLVYDGSHYDALVLRSGASAASASASASAAGDSESATGKLPMFVDAAAVKGADRKWGMVVEGAPMPKGDDHTATVIWAHGLGDTGFGWSPVAQSFGMPWVKFIFPTAPVEPVTLNMGMAMNSWFDIFGLSADADEDTTGILSSAAYLKGLVDKEIAAGIPASRIVLAGFSQGGAIALTAGMAMDKPVAGVIAASTWLPRITMSSAADGMGGTPLLQCHGTSDKVVLYDWGKMSFEKLSGEMGVKGEFKSYPVRCQIPNPASREKQTICYEHLESGHGTILSSALQTCNFDCLNAFGPGHGALFLSRGALGRDAVSPEGHPQGLKARSE